MEHECPKCERLRQERDSLHALINSPHTDDWLANVRTEAAHQRLRYPVEHDAGKTPFDWFWLIGYLAQKAAAAAVAGDTDKALHHTISTGAALLNWHRHITEAKQALMTTDAETGKRPATLLEVGG